MSLVADLGFDPAVPLTRLLFGRILGYREVTAVDNLRRKREQPESVPERQDEVEHDPFPLPEEEPSEQALFWTTATLDQLIAEQGVAAIHDLDALGSLWPADDDPDALLAFVLHERAERRRLGDEEAPKGIGTANMKREHRNDVSAPSSLRSPNPHNPPAGCRRP
jgi:hypothetical protein